MKSLKNVTKLRSLFVSRIPPSVSISMETSSAFANLYTVSAEHFSSLVFPLQMSFNVACGTSAATASRYFVIFLFASKSSMIIFLHLRYSLMRYSVLSSYESTFLFSRLLYRYIEIIARALHKISQLEPQLSIKFLYNMKIGYSFKKFCVSMSKCS